MGTPTCVGARPDVRPPLLDDLRYARAVGDELDEREIFLEGPVVIFKWRNAGGWPVEYASANAVEMFGHGADDFVSGRVSYGEVLHPDDAGRVGREVAAGTASGARGWASEVELLAKVRAMLRIVTLQQEIHKAHRQLKELSTLDGLTGIPNRRHFDETLATEWKRCLRLEAPLSLIISDVDFFKQFNDIYGHQAGDACLRTVAGALHESLFRVEDTVDRYGGEEFAAILPGTDIEGALAVAERMRRSTRELRIPHDRGIDGLISCSFGAACITPTASETPMKLLQSADSGLYIAKRDGRNRVTRTPL